MSQNTFGQSLEKGKLNKYSITLAQIMFLGQLILCNKVDMGPDFEGLMYWGGGMVGWHYPLSHLSVFYFTYCPETSLKLTAITDNNDICVGDELVFRCYGGSYLD